MLCGYRAGGRAHLCEICGHRLDGEEHLHPESEAGVVVVSGVIATSLEVPATVAEVPVDRCGSCRRCIEACPTGALTAPYQMDAGLCISYLTIEKRGEIPAELRSKIGRQVFGCDICQDVCPWNRKAPVSGDPQLQTRGELVNPALEWLADLDEAGFARTFFGSPVKRAKFSGLRRNVAIAMGNSGLARIPAQAARMACMRRPDVSRRRGMGHRAD